jgi:serine phosphatase RsbU (regulator of sigma subunit)
MASLLDTTANSAAATITSASAGALPLLGARLVAKTAVAKVGKYATSESGDTVEVIERPRGGMSVIVADGQRSGQSAKAISNLVVQKCVALLAEGVRDGAVARAAHDALHLQRGGRVSAELTIVSVDLATRTLVISRNSRCPGLLLQGDSMRWLDDPSEAVGIHAFTRPVITELPLQDGLTLLVFTDGIWQAGFRTGERLDLPALLAQLSESGAPVDAGLIADSVLAAALRLDQQRPHDDASVAVVQILATAEDSEIRRMEIQFPL